MTSVGGSNRLISLLSLRVLPQIRALVRFIACRTSGGHLIELLAFQWELPEHTRRPLHAFDDFHREASRLLDRSTRGIQ
jgi:hypothetical protein